MATCKVYKGPQLLGEGAIEAGATSITSWTSAAGYPPIAGRRVAVAITSSTNIGASFQTRVMADNGAGTLTIKDPSPFAT
jgi:hypothetical protein